jgi:mono/diheme cytochrome c family protein
VNVERIFARHISGLALCITLILPAGAADETPAVDPNVNPYQDQEQALNEGEKIYRGRCIGCHFRGGGRGPNIFRSKLSLKEFVEIVAVGGRNGMPAWGNTLSGEEILKVHAFVMSRDRL